MAQIFISYKREDVAIARQVLYALQAKHLKVWWDENLQGGQRWDAKLDEVLLAAGVIVVLWSPKSVLSDWVRHEASIGKVRGILVPAQLEQCDLPAMFAQYQTVSLLGWDGSHDDRAFRRLIGGIMSAISKQRRARFLRVFSAGLALLAAVAIGIGLLRVPPPEVGRPCKNPRPTRMSLNGMSEERKAEVGLHCQALRTIPAVANRLPDGSVNFEIPGIGTWCNCDL